MLQMRFNGNMELAGRSLAFDTRVVRILGRGTIGVRLDAPCQWVLGMVPREETLYFSRGG